MDLSIIILNWNAADDTLRCLQTLAGWQTLRPKIWVVDNASGDDSIARLTQAFPGVMLIPSKKNLGFAGGNNRALTEILKTGDDVPILLLNNDAYIAEADVQTLLDTLRASPSAGFVGPLLVDADQPSRILSAGGQNPVMHLRSHASGRLPSDVPFAVDYVPGTVLLTAAIVFQQIGLLDERYFFGMEMADLCHRAGRAGWKSLINPRVRAGHTISRSARRRRILHPYYISRNRFLFLRKHFPRRADLFVFWSGYSLLLSLKMAATGQHDTARAVWLGLRDGLRGVTGNRNGYFLETP
ncbi:MAG: glycosyltransferase family 2 protein [Chloroflexi bacterium]|nr:MAG: glycosyltransferase family 2 protein [Chloroflexota bacterium]